MTPDLNRCVEELTRLLGTGGVLTGGERLRDYAHDESDVAPSVPAVVCFPESSGQVQAVLACTSGHRLPVTPVGARTGKSGGSVPSTGGVALSLERMNRIKEISSGDLVCVCEPGVLTIDLMRAVEERGLFYPPDPASLESCTIGGNIAENAGGPRALKYGVTREWVLGLEVVLASGQILRTGHRSIKGVAGYDLTALMVGSEGTLGVVTEATLKLRPLPREVVTALITFPSLRGAAGAVGGVLGSGSLPRALELMDARAIQAVDGTYYRFPARTEAALLIELDGDAADPLLEEMIRLERICRGFGAGEMAVAVDPAQRERLWTARRRISEAVHTIKPLKMSEDVAVPLSRIPDMIEAVQQIAARRDLVAVTYGHAGDGNLHVNFLYDTADERPGVEAAVAEVLHQALTFGGTITGEHGIGLCKRAFLSHEQAPELIEFQRQLKRLFDPLGLLNPGKIFEDPSPPGSVAGNPAGASADRGS